MFKKTLLTKIKKRLCPALSVLIGVCVVLGAAAAREEKMPKTLIVYFSVSGNTKRVAEIIQKETKGDIARIQPQTPYQTNDMSSLSEQGQKEVNAHYQPPIEPLPDVSLYDRIVVGTPTWWYTMAPAVRTFFTQTDLKGKTVVLFMTNAGWPGTVIKDMKAAAGGAHVIAEKEVLFDSNGGHNMQTAESEIKNWIQSWK